MPFGFGSPVFTSSAGGDIGGGRHYTRLRGPVLVGAQAAEMTFASGGGSAGTQGAPWQSPHIANVSTVSADLCLVASTFGAAAGPTVGTVTSSAPSGVLWISAYASSGTAGALIGATSPNPQTGGNAAVALIFDGAYPTLTIYNPRTSTYLYPHAQVASTASLSGGVITWSASSS